MKKILRIASMVIALFMFIPYSSDINIIVNEIKAFAETEESSESSDSQDEVIDDNMFQSDFAFPENMRAVTVTPGKDFLVDSSQSIDETQKEIDKIIENASMLEMNSIIINTNYDDKAYFSSTSEVSLEELSIKKLIETAKDNYFFVYVNFDINYVLNQVENGDLESRVNFLTHIAHKFSRDFLIDGIILTGYYSNKSVENYKFYMDNGSGIGFENWLLENGAYVFSLVSESIHMTDTTIPVGICISNVWQNSSTNNLGSDTNDIFEALTDGFSDTVSYLENGYADFIMLNTIGSLTDEDLPLETVVKWWSEKAVNADIPLFVCHANERICTDAAGWISPDQIVKQLIAIRDMSNYKGSAYNSYSNLIKKSEANDALVNYYQGKINEESLDIDITMNSPTSRNFSTYEPSIAFQGTYDENFNVYFNEEPIKLNDAGNFYYDVPLDVGLNTFKIRCKAKTVTYKITRKIVILKEYEPLNTVRVEGKTKISVSALAYKGAKVTASLNGKTISLNETDGQWAGSDPNSSYALFTGSFTTPEGKVLKEQNLGQVVFRGSYENAESETRYGATVIVNALPENCEPTQLIKITTDNAMTYDYNNTSRIPSPTNSRLPAGTLDYYIKKVTYSGVSYYLTQSGKRIKASDATVVSGYTFGANNLTVSDTYIDGDDTVIKLKMDSPIPFNVKYSSCSYYHDSGGDYYISNFNASTVTLEFDYITDASGVPNFPSGAMFKSSSWTTTTYNGKTRYQLNLNLARSGIYAGITTSYSSDGTLTLRFNGYRHSIAGSVIVIDPGHGMGAKTSGVWDPGATYYVVEQEMNIQIARRVRDKLKAQGAIVYMLPTDTQQIMTIDRSSYARQYNPDMYISIHCNAAKSYPNTRGTEAFYFTPFSQPLADSISNNVASYFTNHVYNDGANKNRGDKWDYYYVTLQHDFPSILVELGFVSNYEDAMALANSTHQDGIANAIVAGINQYFSR